MLRNDGEKKIMNKYKKYSTLQNTTDEELCGEIENYLNGKSSIPVPSLEDFCLNKNYDMKDLLLSSSEVQYAIRKIYLRAIVTLEKFLLIDVSRMEFSNDGKHYKLDKQGIMHQLVYLRKIMKE